MEDRYPANSNLFERVHANARVLIWLFLVCLGGVASGARIDMAGNQVFSTDPSGRLQIIDVSTATNPVVVTTYPNFGGISGLALHGAYALATLTNEGFIIFDVTKTPPTLVSGGRYVTAGNSRDVKFFGTTAFVADGTNGVVVLDLFDVHAPLNLATINFSGNAMAVDVVGNRLFVAAGTGGLRIYDITAPNAPLLLGTWNTSDPATRVRISGNTAFVLCEGGRMEVVNVANVGSPSLAATYLATGDFADVDLAGSYAVLANTNGNVILFDISNVSAPLELSTNVVANGAAAVRLIGANAYVRSGTGTISVVPLSGPAPLAPALLEAVPEVLAASGQTAVMSVLVSGSPPFAYEWRKNGQILTNDVRTAGVNGPLLVISNAIPGDSGNYAVTVTSGFGQLVSSNVLTVVNLGAPVLRSEFHPGGTAEGIVVKDLTAYVAAGNFGFEIYSVVNPNLPYRLGGNDVAGYTTGIQVSGDNAFVAATTGGLQVFNTTQLPVARQLAATDTPGLAQNLVLAGGLIYVADGDRGVQIYAFNNTATPGRVGGFDTAGFARNVSVQGDIAYVADGTNGLAILSVTNPAAPVLLGSYDTSGEVRSIRVFGGNAFLADDSGGVVILSVTNPASPTLVGTYSGATPALDLELAENTLVVACGSNGVLSLDVSVPTAITLRGAYAVNPANSVRLEGNRVYVAAGSGGVRILELVGLPVAAPSIDFIPPDVVVLAGASASFAASASGSAPLSYQWYRAGVALTNSANRSGVATPTLAFANLTEAESGEYVLEVRNAWNLIDLATVNLAVVPFGTPVLQSGYFYDGDALNLHVVGQLAMVASRVNGLQAIDWTDPLDPILIGQQPTLGFAQDVRVQGRYAYVASWSAGLEVFDVLNPTNLVRVGVCDTPGFARMVRVDGNRAYVADSIGGMSIIDISDPTRPALLGRAGTFDIAMAVASVSNQVYVAAAGAGLEIFNAANPLAPTWLGHIDTPGSAENLAVANDRVYVADHHRGVEIIAVTNPAAPLNLGAFQTEGDAFAVQVKSNRAYVAMGIKQVAVLDVSNPTAVTQVAPSLGGDGVRGLQVVGSHALYADRNSGLLIAELLGTAAAAPSVTELNRSGIDAIGQELVLSVAVEGTPPLSYAWRKDGQAFSNSVTISGVTQPHLRFASLVASNAGNYSVVISNAAGSVTSAVTTVTAPLVGAPTARGTFDTLGTAAAATVFGNVGLIADGAGGLQLVSLTNLNQPTTLGSLAVTGSVFGLCLQTNLLYLAMGTNGVAIVDISTPTQPTLVGGFDTPGFAQTLDVTNGLAYVADGSSGLRIYNVATPTAPVASGFFDTPGSAVDVRVSAGRAYVADSSAGLRILSVTNPAAPVSLGTFSNTAPVNAIRVVGTLVYLANGNQGLQILETTNAAAPVILGSYPTANATGLDVNGEIVIVADGSAGYVVLNASNPAVISLVATANPGSISGVTLLGNLALLAGNNDGLRIVDLSGVAARPPIFMREPTNTAVLFGGVAQMQALPLGGTPGLSYRWYANGFPLFDDGRINGSATTQLTISNVVFTDGGAYQLRVLGPAGVTNSSVAQLTFIGPLQAQINAAATNAVIDLTAGGYTENLVIDRNLTLNGAWWNKPVLSGGNNGPAVRILPGASVTLRGMAIRNGTTTEWGGGVLNEGNLTLDHCLVADNVAAVGGGIANLNSLLLVQTVVSNNFAITSGGGIFTTNNATTTLSNCIVIVNDANFGGGLATAGTNLILNSLIASNLAYGDAGLGGGVRVTAGTTRLVNATLSGNTALTTSSVIANGRGGALQAAGGRVELEFSTIAANAAMNRGGGVSALGAATVYARNSVFADNTGSSQVDFSGTLNSGGFNLIQIAAGATITGTNTGNRLNVAAQLESLRDNGGPTLTHAPASTSPLIDGGGAPGPGTDTRGLLRPFDTPWMTDVASTFDVGAFEYLDRTPFLIVSNRLANGFYLSWATNSVLQKSLQPQGAWADQTNTSPLFVSTTTNLASFFRLRANVSLPVLTTNYQTANSFQLSWPDFGILEHAPTADGPWEFAASVSPYQVQVIPSQSEFFRLRVISH